MSEKNLENQEANVSAQSAEARTVLTLVSDIAKYMGELCGAARSDWSSVGYDEIGMNGTPIKEWRQAYFEGCKDMAEGITARLPEEYHEAMRKIARDEFAKAFEIAQAAPKEEKPHPEGELALPKDLN